MLGPWDKFWRILISLLIFFLRTVFGEKMKNFKIFKLLGLRIFMTFFSLFRTLIPSKTSEYFPLPIF